VTSARPYFSIVVETIVEGLLAVFKTHGPWALVALGAVVIWRMALHIQEIHEKHQAKVQELLLDHHKEQKEEIKQLVTVMTLTEKSSQAMNETIMALIQRRD